MLADELGIAAPDLWRLSFWELGAICAARIDRNSDDLKPLDSLFEQFDKVA